MDIRLARKEEIELFISIKQEFNRDYGVSEKSESFIIKEFEDYINRGCIVVAIIDSKIIGYLAGIIEEDLYERFGYIGEVFISKNFRNKGISTKLKDKFIEFLKSKNINLCRIDVNPDNPAQEVYKKWGFKIDKHRMSLKF
ncbi:TPA: GNAT family N-acetyltransferase [bacterium]|nr:GNAT family N-acetyltransferase [bacterium]